MSARLLASVLLLAAAGGAQTEPLRVRLYAVQAPPEVTLRGSVRWKNCERCELRSTPELKLAAEGTRVRMGGEERPQTTVWVGGDYQLLAPGHAPLRSSYPLEVRAQQGRLVLVAAIPLEEYVGAVLAGESGGFQHAEAMKAMAVAVRTYAARHRERHAAEGFDLCDTTHCQDLRLGTGNPRAQEAARATAGELLRFRNTLAETYYHQSCGGTTAAAQEVWPALRAPYLKQQSDTWCAARPLAWQATLTRAELEQALAGSQVRFPAGWQALEVSARTSSGRAQRLRFRSPGVDVELSASTLRFAVGRTLGWNRIRSDLYEVRATPQGVLFTGRGAGHGVGLCQAGAEEMAAQGRSYRDILAFYYPGTEIRAPEGAVAWQTLRSERFEAQVTSTADGAVLDLAERLVDEVERATGWKLAHKPRIQVFPTLEAYRDMTGQPGWVAATTRGRTIRLQPLAALRARGALESTLRHELLHLVIEGRAHRSAPLWLREGVVLYFDGAASRPAPPMSDEQMERALRQPRSREELDAAYAAARARVAALVRVHGQAAVLESLRSGVALDPGARGGRRD